MGIKYVENRDAAKHHTKYRTCFHHKEVSRPIMEPRSRYLLLQNPLLKRQVLVQKKRKWFICRCW